MSKKTFLTTALLAAVLAVGVHEKATEARA
jgi:hypothetical protein